MDYHRLKSWASKEPLDRRQEGIFVLATLRPVGLLLWLGVITYLARFGDAYRAYSESTGRFVPKRTTAPPHVAP